MSTFDESKVRRTRTPGVIGNGQFAAQERREPSISLADLTPEVAELVEVDLERSGRISALKGDEPERQTAATAVDAALAAHEPLDYSQASRPTSRLVDGKTALVVSGPQRYEAYISRGEDGKIHGTVSAPRVHGRAIHTGDQLDAIANQYGGGHAREALVAAFEAAEANSHEARQPDSGSSYTHPSGYDRRMGEPTAGQFVPRSREARQPDSGPSYTHPSGYDRRMGEPTAGRFVPTGARPSESEPDARNDDASRRRGALNRFFGIR